MRYAVVKDMIIVENITKSYSGGRGAGSKKALDNVSISIENNGVVGLLGPNGAGKSTLMKILCGYLLPDEGKASVCGFDTVAQQIEVRKNIGYLPENNPLYLDLYVREYLSFVAEIYLPKNEVRKAVKNALETVNFGDEANKKTGALSKGYRQRLGLAAALVHNPKVLILDEPTSGLDPNQLEEIRSLLRELGRQKTVLLSTHIMQEVEMVCDRIIILNKGVVATDKYANELNEKLETIFHSLTK
ncbi:MAG: ATP-binding cassette domain-containing protein [Bacteroidales bacterium]|jgi:ABC-2 type transport system ATP-binding protein|nr:ATP-binding cassette domain-containing protein [Bacteroidales bacterium]